MGLLKRGHWAVQGHGKGGGKQTAALAHVVRSLISELPAYAAAYGCIKSGAAKHLRTKGLLMENTEGGGTLFFQSVALAGGGSIASKGKKVRNTEHEGINIHRHDNVQGVMTVKGAEKKKYSY